MSVAKVSEILNAGAGGILFVIPNEVTAEIKDRAQVWHDFWPRPLVQKIQFIFHDLGRRRVSSLHGARGPHLLYSRIRRDQQTVRRPRRFEHRKGSVCCTRWGFSTMNDSMLMVLVVNSQVIWPPFWSLYIENAKNEKSLFVARFLVHYGFIREKSAALNQTRIQYILLKYPRMCHCLILFFNIRIESGKFLSHYFLFYV